MRGTWESICPWGVVCWGESLLDSCPVWLGGGVSEFMGVISGQLEFPLMQSLRGSVSKSMGWSGNGSI